MSKEGAGLLSHSLLFGLNMSVMLSIIYPSTEEDVDIWWPSTIDHTAEYGSIAELDWLALSSFILPLIDRVNLLWGLFGEQCNAVTFHALSIKLLYSELLSIDKTTLPSAVKSTLEIVSSCIRCAMKTQGAALRVSRTA
jgi:hypothetical protein